MSCPRRIRVISSNYDKEVTVDLPNCELPGLVWINPLSATFYLAWKSGRYSWKTTLRHFVTWERWVRTYPPVYVRTREQIVVCWTCQTRLGVTTTPGEIDAMIIGHNSEHEAITVPVEINPQASVSVRGESVTAAYLRSMQ